MTGSSGPRGFWPMRDLPTVGWLVATVVATLVHPYVPAPRWLMIHLLVLGAVGHAILVWSRYFADTLLRRPATPRRPQTVRLAAFNLGVAAVVAGVLADTWPVTVTGAVAIGAAALWHGAGLMRQLGGALGSRFAPTVRYYVAAAGLLPLGGGLGAWLARDLASPLHEQVRAAHVALNVFGWIGLTVLGTLVTLWPTMLRTRMVDNAEAAARRALPLLLLGIVVMAGTALAGFRPGYALGLVAYLAGIGVLSLPSARTAVAKPPASFPAWSVAAGAAWLIGCLVVLVATTAVAGSWVTVDGALATVTPLLAAGFAAQVLLGASSYLIPVVLGGGPHAVRAAHRALDSASGWRLVVTNLGLLVCALPVPSLVRVVTSVLVLVALASFVPLLFVALRASRRAKAQGSPDHPRPPGPAVPDGDRPAGQRTGLAAAGLATVLVAVAVGAALDPAALGRPVASASAGVTATGRTTQVEVVARGMRFTPDTIRVPAGNRLVVTVRNEDEDGDTHDLVLETGARTARIAPGERDVLDAGVVGRDLDGWCSVVGHRQMGMVLTIEVSGAPSAEDASGSLHDSHDHGGTRATGPAPETPDDGPTGEQHSHEAVLDPMAEPADGFRARDARLGPAPPGRTHRHTFTITESEIEVAPGVRQTWWTYNGLGPGPTLHGKVGDHFVIRLVNDGSIGHSVDFHAGALAPDEPMRTIGPGESLVYRFTATRAGIWMYHCSTMPMSAHIANGLFGAVVIEPRDLPEADRSFVLVQSELYLGPQGGEVDMDALLAEQPDGVVFNGYANQYDADPLRVRVGERVRIWVLAAGPSRGTSFHVVGGQFDRVWSEGSWLLGSARSPARGSGAQSLALAAAQGGFVELTLPEPGHYRFVNHVMVDAERGARGTIVAR